MHGNVARYEDQGPPSHLEIVMALGGFAWAYKSPIIMFITSVLFVSQASIPLYRYFTDSFKHQ
jgi:hypothetical protein